MRLERGQQAELAKRVGVSRSLVNEIVHGKKYCPSSLAIKLENVSEAVTGRHITAREWILAGLGGGA